MDFSHESVENLKHIKRIADAMAPDPTQWEYHGDCIDAGSLVGAQCTCGHPIRYVFPVVNPHDGRTLPIGSTCISSTVPYLIASGADSLAEKLSAAQQKLQKKISKKYADEQKRKRDHKNNRIVMEMEKDLRDLIGVHNDFRSYHISNGSFIPYFFYRQLILPKACKTPGFTKRRIKNTYKKWVSSWVDCRRYDTEHYRMELPPIPIPKTVELLDILLGEEK